jgi:hypothetical protein
MHNYTAARVTAAFGHLRALAAVCVLLSGGVFCQSVLADNVLLSAGVFCQSVWSVTQKKEPVSGAPRALRAVHVHVLAAAAGLVYTL